jgi:hypothetical protein
LPKHVLLIIEENQQYNDVMQYMPYLVGLGKQYGYTTNYVSDNGGSLLDYLWLASGSCESSVNCTLSADQHDFGCTGGGCTSIITDDNIFREMNNAGISWKVYAQSYAAAGGYPTAPDNGNGTSYYRRHNGATWYSEIVNNVANSGANIVDLSQLTLDIQNDKLPTFMIIVPDGGHDAHDCVAAGCAASDQLPVADQFLKQYLGAVLATKYFQSGQASEAFVTFDECGSGTDAGCSGTVYTAVIGPQVIPHTVSSRYYKHESLLRTMLEALGINTFPGWSAGAADMGEFFTSQKP